VRDELSILAGTTVDRNNQLFKSVAALGEFVDVDRTWLRAEAARIANSIGLDEDRNCAPRGIANSIESAFKAADRSGYRDVPQPRKAKRDTMTQEVGENKAETNGQPTEFTPPKSDEHWSPAANANVAPEWRAQTGARFILDIPAKVPTLWATGTKYSGPKANP
jgi:hypothetical protein